MAAGADFTGVGALSAEDLLAEAEQDGTWPESPDPPSTVRFDDVAPGSADSRTTLTAFSSIRSAGAMLAPA